jgi:UV DNA damage endonuclease
MTRYGYACINMTLGAQGIYTGRTMRKATLNTKGLDYVAELALQNVLDLEKILKWNNDNDIHVFRVGSDIIPWGNKIDITTLPNFSEISNVLSRCGKFATDHDIRISSHPGPFNLLASSREEVVTNTILDLEMHSLIFDLMNLSRTPYNKINIHIGATYGDKIAAAQTWCKNFLRLSEGARARLTIENDDKENMYSVADLHRLIYQEVGIPIVFDYHHHTFCPGDLSEREALYLAASTWRDCRQAVHYSESKALHESNSKLNPRAHSDYIVGVIDTYGLDVDVMIEAKAKELALLNYLKIFS